MTALYHYCSMASLLKIIESASIHCSNLYLTNDPNEIVLAKRTLIPEFFHNRFGTRFHGNDNTHEFFALSFSRKPDVLSQWRGYGDIGKGVMLELDLDVLQACNYAFSMSENNIHKLNDSTWGTPVFEVVDVVYHPDEFKDKLEETYKDHDDGKLLKSMKNMDPTDRNFINFINRLNGLSSCYKSEFYEEEQEVRCVIFSDINEAGYRPIELHSERWGEAAKQQVVFLESQGKLSPRIPLRLKFNHLTAISNVMLGPANTNNKDVVQAILQKYGFADTKISVSRGAFGCR